MKSAARLQPWNFTEYLFLAAFLFWSFAGLIFTFARLTPVDIGGWVGPGKLRDFIDLCIYNGDPILILLAFINTHLHAARQWTGGVARRWAFIIVVGAFLIETFGTLTGLPFGDYHYSERFGTLLGYVPLTIPLAWHVIITNALFLVRTAAPHLSRLVEALAVGVICMLYDVVLEPFATLVKQYWTWNGGEVPMLNYVSWLVLSGLLVWLFAPSLSNRFRFDVRPALIVACTVLIFLAGEWASRTYR